MFSKKATKEDKSNCNAITITKDEFKDMSIEAMKDLTKDEEIPEMKLLFIIYSAEMCNRLFNKKESK